MRRLQTDRIDLVYIFNEEGANAALVEARNAGQDQAHRPHRTQEPPYRSAYARSYQGIWVQVRYGADALNVMDPHYRSFEKLVLPDLVRQAYLE